MIVQAIWLQRQQQKMSEFHCDYMCKSKQCIYTLCWPNLIFSSTVWLVLTRLPGLIQCYTAFSHKNSSWKYCLQNRQYNSMLVRSHHWPMALYRWRGFRQGPSSTLAKARGVLSISSCIDPRSSFICPHCYITGYLWTTILLQSSLMGCLPSFYFWLQDILINWLNWNGKVWPYYCGYFTIGYLIKYIKPCELLSKSD